MGNISEFFTRIKNIQVDNIYTNFHETFDENDYNILIQKLNSYF